MCSSLVASRALICLGMCEVVIPEHFQFFRSLLRLMLRIGLPRDARGLVCQGVSLFRHAAIIFTADDAVLATNASKTAHGRETICVSLAQGEMDGVQRSMCSDVVSGGAASFRLQL
jgi:hypothetical protein